MKKQLLVLFLCCSAIMQAQQLEELWQSPPDEARPWTFWYWMQGAVSKEGITADLEAMKEIGLDGAYLMPIKAVPEKPFIEPSAEQLSPLWWEMIDFSIREAARLNMKLGFHFCDGFALAGGPWITPETSMQKIVWSKASVKGGKKINIQLPQPESFKGFYQDIAIYAYPALDGDGVSTENVIPSVSTSISGVDAVFLADTSLNETFRSEEACWIQYAFNEPFTARSVQIKPAGRNFQSQRLSIEACDDGKSFRKIIQLEAPRHGWQNDDFPITYSIPTVTAKYFRFVYDLAGTEPGAEDLDASKWKQSLKVKRITLSSEARINGYEGKNASVWRVSKDNGVGFSVGEYIPKQKLINVTKFVDKEGNLNWKAPSGKWTILRMGHTSTGHTNATGGGGAGLECDKFNPEIVKLQFDSWFGRIYEYSDNTLAQKVIKMFHVDSWECGGQNWSSVFREEFQKRRGYDVVDFLPVMAGIPIENNETSEKILYDVRQTVSELVVDVFYGTLRNEAHKKGCQFSAESIAPTFTSDGLMHYKYADLPMGEFWLQSPTHDKPNDMLDAISGAHIYGKNIVQAEGFTQLRSTFTEYPEMLKTLQDRVYASGINRLSYHVLVQNPWLDRKPGMTLDGIGLYFQRDQTWWKQGKAWVDYATRCQAFLQFGEPVVDLAVFIGDEIPRRSILPDRLVPFLPGIFGDERVESEKIRMRNDGTPTRQMPVGVTYSSNIFHSEDWVNPLRGYAYDCLNPDVLTDAKVILGDIVLSSGMTYKALLVPGKHPMNPNKDVISEKTKKQLERLKYLGARLIETPYWENDFSQYGFERDFLVTEMNTDKYAENIAYTHRSDGKTDIYFISNQDNKARKISVSLRVGGKVPELWNPVTGKRILNQAWEYSDSRTILPLELDKGESVFVVFRTLFSDVELGEKRQVDITEPQEILTISSPWSVHFRGRNDAMKSLKMNKLTLWNEMKEDSIRFFSGTAIYSNSFVVNNITGKNVFVELENVFNIATVKINGKDCGTIWTRPYRLNITDVLIEGNNTIEIEVANTWANRLMGDEDFAAKNDAEKQTWTNARYRVAEKKLVPSGLSGYVKILTCE